VATTAGNQCTTNFIFTNGTDVFLGMAAHCAGTGPATATGGCQAESLPLGTEVEVDGASQPGTLAYSSWLAMQRTGEDNPNACAFNDFALVKLAPGDVANTTPTVPYFGGPTGLDADGTSQLEPVYSYGNSPLRAGIEPLSPKSGLSTGTTGGGWSHQVLTVTPGIPGDSGSGFMDTDGRAFGVLSTLAIAPLPGSNGVTDLAHALRYANTHGTVGDVALVRGTQEFTAPLLPLGM
jgi:hypothetical protein